MKIDSFGRRHREMLPHIKYFSRNIVSAIFFELEFSFALFCFCCGANMLLLFIATFQCRIDSFNSEFAGNECRQIKATATNQFGKR